MGKDVGVTARGKGLRPGKPRTVPGVKMELFEAGQGLDYLEGRVCPEIRLCGQGTETSLVPWKKCREARREWPYRLNKYH